MVFEHISTPCKRSFFCQSIHSGWRSLRGFEEAKEAFDLAVEAQNLCAERAALGVHHIGALTYLGRGMHEVRYVSGGGVTAGERGLHQTADFAGRAKLNLERAGYFARYYAHLGESLAHFRRRSCR